MFDFIIQGYPFTAFLLFFLYCFHRQARSYYYSLARTANVLLWLYLIVGFGFIVYALMGLHILFGIFRLSGSWHSFRGDLLSYVVLPYLIMFIALLFKKVRKQAVWILLPLAFLIRPTILFGDFRSDETYTNILLNSLIFLVVSIVVNYVVTSTKDSIAKENNRLPDRI